MAHPLPTQLLTGCNGGVLYCSTLYVNNVTLGWFVPLMLLGFIFVIFMAMQRLGTPKAYGFATVSGLLGALIFATLQLMTWWVASAFIIAGASGFVVMLMEGRG